MSYERTREDTKPCWCGKGTITDVLETNDWFQSKEYREINCPDCQKRADAEAAARALRESKREELRAEALRLAETRYLSKWLALYAGLTKKQAWNKYTGGRGYPALGTFYKHVKHAGSVDDYMKWRFETDFEQVLVAMGVKDRDIEDLMSQRSLLRQGKSSL